MTDTPKLNCPTYTAVVVATPKILQVGSVEEIDFDAGTITIQGETYQIEGVSPEGEIVVNVQIQAIVRHPEPSHMNELHEILISQFGAPEAKHYIDNVYEQLARSDHYTETQRSHLRVVPDPPDDDPGPNAA